MKTLIELYSDRAIENVIGPETFRPERVVYLCTTEIIIDSRPQKILKSFFENRGLHTEVRFMECSPYKADKILRLLKKIDADCPDCAVDVTGGTDAALFAAGMFCMETGKPAFTYSRKRNRFYNIINADFADDLECTLKYSVEEFFAMTGGTLRKGRGNSILADHISTFGPFFKIFLKYRRKWPDEITYLQRISQCAKDQPVPLKVEGAFEQKGERGSRVYADPELLEDLKNIGYIKDLKIVPGESVAFTFKNEEIRSWLRDVGAVLELYMYKVCVETGAFEDVISSAIVDWDGTVSHDSVSNEIDAVAARGVIPLFISCKATDIKTEAINELAILRDRFGGKGAKAIIVTTEYCNAAARHRAAQLEIAVIDLEELVSEQAGNRILTVMKLDTKHI